MTATGRRVKVSARPRITRAGARLAEWMAPEIKK
jgi:hypothetical protein